MKSIRYEKDTDNIVHLVFDNPTESANLLNAEFRASMAEAVNRLENDGELAGVILRSAKSSFFAGADLKELVSTQQHGVQAAWDLIAQIKDHLRRLETLGRPVVAAINGAAMGGGWELCLAAHYRVALNSPKMVCGLPEVTLGLLPGAGGIVKMVRLLGIEAALPYVLEGKTFNAVSGHELGLINDIAQDEEDMIARAVAWIQANPEARQPWDTKGYKIPGGTPANPGLAQKLIAAPAMLRQKTRGCYPAQEAILAVAVESTQVDIDSALRIETRYFVELAQNPVTRNMITAFWFQLNQIKTGVSRPQHIERSRFSKVGVLGAGMMGSGIAYACATRGLEVILKDISTEQASKGKAYSEAILNIRVERGRMDAAKRDETLSKIKPTCEASDLGGCDLVIEAVFEDPKLKAGVTQEAEAQLAENAVFASNTSTLPISGLAEASQRPANFIGLHFFSPVDKMPLVEIIVGEKTSDETLARGYDFALQIGKTPIVVNDSRGFYTSRVISTFVLEAVGMLAEGVHPAVVENAALLDGFPIGPLALTDELSLTLSAKIRQQTVSALAAQGIEYEAQPADAIIDWMLEQQRAGKAAGKGFYQYPDNGKKTLWRGLVEHFTSTDNELPLQDVKERMLFIQSLEAVRCLDEGVIMSSRDANIGSIFGIGFPGWTGGTLQFINGYGLQAFIDRANELADRYGNRFRPPESLMARVAANEEY